MRLIDADALKSVFTEKSTEAVCGAELCKAIISRIDDAPTVDAVPVRHGKWLDLEAFKRPWFRHHIFECSVCRNTLDMDGVNAGRGDANYCPNCGAKMDEERKEEWQR